MAFLVLIGTLSSTLSLAGKLAYIDIAAGNGGAAYVLDVATDAATQVGPGRQDGPPHWSPDGAWLALETNTDRGRGIYVVDAAGENGHVIPSERAWNTAPFWSTDGTRVGYCSAEQRGGLTQLRVYDLNAGKESVWGGGRLGLVCPAWMPYSQLMNSLNPELKLEVPGVNIDLLRDEARLNEQDIRGHVVPEAILAIQEVPDLGGKMTALQTRLVLVSKSEVLPLREPLRLVVSDAGMANLDGVLWDVTPNWSGHRYRSETPSGKQYGPREFAKPGETTRIAFDSNGGGDREIYVVGKKGIANVTNHRTADWNPVWSPDGRSLAFESFRGGRRGIYVVYTDTAHVETVAAPSDGDCWFPAWSSDGNELAYVSDQHGQAELYTVPLKGGAAVQLTRVGGPKEAPTWRPEVN